MKVSRQHLEPILERLYSFYPRFVDTNQLSWDVMKKMPDDEVRGVCLYLKDKGLIRQGPKGRWRINASGIDLLEGRF